MQDLPSGEDCNGWGLRFKCFVMEAHATQLNLSDAELAVRIAPGGDLQMEDFMMLYQRYAGLLLAWSLNNSGRSNAEDLAQDVWTKIWEALTEGRVDGKNFRSLLFTTARNLLIDKWRRNRREPVLDDEALSGVPASNTAPDAVLIERERTAKLSSCLKKLRFANLQQAEVAKLKLKAVDVQEICEQLNVKREVIDKAWFNAKNWLRSCVGQESS